MEKYIDINSPKVSIKCKLFCDKIREIEHIVIYLHGFAGHKDTKTADKFAESLLSKIKNSAVLIFDLPCHGKDVRKLMSLEECGQYISKVIQYAKSELNVPNIYAYGTSFGGYLLLKYITDEEANPFRKIALRCPAVKMYDTLNNGVIQQADRELLEKGKSIEAGFDRKIRLDMTFLEDLKRDDISQRDFLDYADDILVVQGTKDELIDYDDIREFCDNNVIELVTIEKADHRFTDVNLLKLAHSHMMGFLFGN